MAVNSGGNGELKRIVHEVIGNTASNLLMSRVCAILDEKHKDPAALKEACVKIEKIVGLFIGDDHAQTLSRRFKESVGY